MVIFSKYTWTEQGKIIQINIEVRGATKNAVDIVATQTYFKLNSNPYICELFLLHPIVVEKSKVKVSRSLIEVELVKVSDSEWGSLIRQLTKEEQNDERSRELEQFSADQAKARSKKHEDEAYQKRALTYHQIDKEQEERRKIGEIEKEIQTDFLSEFFKGIHPTDLSEREREQLAKQENAEANEDNDDVDPNLPPIRRKAVLTTTFTPKPGNFNLPAREKEMKPVVHRPQLPVFTDDESKYQSVEYLSQRGDSSFKAKDFHNALEQYNSALSLDPRHTPSLLHRCVVHLSLSHWQNALEDALEIDKLLTDPDTAPSPNTPKVRSKNWARAALACNEMRRFEDALSYISRAIQLDPDNQEFLQQRTHYEANVTAQKVERAKAFGSSSTSESGGSIVAEHFSVT